MNKRIVHDALILTAFTLILGLVLGGVYHITKPRIDEENKKAQEKAFREVFDKADSFEAIEYDADQAQKIVSDEGYSDSIDDVQKALDKDGGILGYVITVTAKDGSQGSITFSVGIQSDGTVNGYSITDIAETPGLGMKAVSGKFPDDFRNKKVDKFEIVKQTPASDEQVESITGSTITSKAVANGCNAAILYFKNELQEVAES